MQPQFVAAFESTSNALANDSDSQCHLQTYVHVITIDSTILKSYPHTDTVYILCFGRVCVYVCVGYVSLTIETNLNRIC
jgi:hypothetical protein